MQQMTNYYIDILKYNFNENNIKKEEKLKIFKEAYLDLKLEHKIDLLSRRKDKEALYKLLENEYEIEIFTKIVLSKIRKEGYKLYLPKNFKFKITKTREELKLNEILKIKELIKRQEQKIQVDIYRNLYSKLAVKDINLYSRRKNNKKALLDYVDSHEIDTVKECFLSVIKEYDLKV